MEHYDNKVIICVPTKDRPEIIRDVLNYELQYYEKLKVHVRYYDSSETDLTKNIINNYILKGSKYLSYVRTPSNQCLDYKLIDFLKNDSYLRQYHYIWLINDATSIYEEALIEILMHLNDNYHLVRLPIPSGGKTENYIYTDQNLWFQECSHGMSLMASTIMNVSMLNVSDKDWDLWQKKYVKNNDIDSEEHGFFFMVAFFLERILQLNSFKGLYVNNRLIWWRVSPLKLEQHYWSSLVFATWAGSYPQTILELPDCYTEKEFVICTSDNIYRGRFGKRALISYRLCKLFDLLTYYQYERYFYLVSDLKLSEIKKIAKTPRIFFKFFHKNFENLEKNWISYLNKHKRVFNKSKDIIVYGAGFYGQNIVKYLINVGWREKLRYVAVTNIEGNLSEIEGIPVRCIDELDNYKKCSIILIATLPGSAEQIHNTLKIKGFKYIVELF